MITPKEAGGDPAPGTGAGNRTLDPELVATARRRAQAVLAGHSGDIGALRRFLADDNETVRASAYAALAALEAAGAGVAMQSDGAAASTDPSPVVRRRAAEVAQRLPGVDLLVLLADDDHLVCEAAAFALGEVNESRADAPAAVIDQLCVVARSHTDPLCRESAVAALGSIGDPRGLATILDALADRPAIRRRAVIALAPFEGDAVSAALESSLSDRDWQVRQVAEDLLGHRPAGD